MTYDPKIHAPDDVRWWEALGDCRGGCGKPGTGLLRDSRNSSHGAWCQKCADKRLATAKRQRELFAKSMEASDG